MWDLSFLSLWKMKLSLLPILVASFHIFGFSAGVKSNYSSGSIALDGGIVFGSADQAIVNHNVSGNFFDDDLLPMPIGGDVRNHSQDYLQTEMEESVMPVRPPECQKTVTNCLPITPRMDDYFMGLGVLVKYKDAVFLGSSENKTMDFIRAAQRLNHHADCWKVVQPLVFAIALTKCVGDQRRLVPTDQCIKINQTCGEHAIAFLPEELRMLRDCNNTEIFTSNKLCINEISWFKDLKSNTTSTCPFPLKHTDDSIKATFKNGQCGMQCQSPFFNEGQLYSLHVYVAVLVSFSFFFNGSAFIFLVRRWRSLKKYPDQCMLFINVCFIMSDIGWAIQFSPGARELISCSEDGTERLNEPRHGEKYALCLVTFILIYYFMMAAALWFVAMSYCWYRSFRALNSNEVKAKGFLRNYSIFFHVFAWVTPLLMTFIVVATSSIEGNNTTGVCFIGMQYGYVRTFLLLVPLCLVALGSGIFMVRGLLLLYRIKTHREHNFCAKDQSNIRSTMLHIGFIAVAVCICIFTSVFIHVHYYIYKVYYATKRSEFIQCHLGKAIFGDEPSENCLSEISMDYETIELGVHLALQFIAGIIFSSWVWRQNQLSSFVKMFKRKLKRVGTAMRLSTISPQTLTDGAMNPTPIASNVTTDPDPTSLQQTIVSFHQYSSENLYDSVYNLRDESMRDLGVMVDSPDEGSNFSSSTPTPEDRLGNWQNQARDCRNAMRSAEMRKISSSNGFHYSRSSSAGTLIDDAAQDESVNVIMDYPATRRQRRPGRVEFFKQGRPRSSMQSPARSVSQIDVHLEEDVDLAVSENNVRKTSKQNFTSPVEQSINRDSPDEGIDVERHDDTSRESLTDEGGIINLQDRQIDSTSSV